VVTLPLLLATFAGSGRAAMPHWGLQDTFTVMATDLFFLPSLPVLTGAAALVRRWLGYLTGFTVGVIAVLTAAAYGVLLWSHVRGVSLGGLFGIPKLLGAVLLARVPFFRRKALDLSPPSRFKGLSGTYAVSLGENEGAAVSLGRRAPGERRHSLRRSRRPAHWDPSFRELPRAPRVVRGRAIRSLFVGRGAIAVWAYLSGGTLASLATVALASAPRHPPYEDEGPAGYTLFLVGLIALCLLRFSALRLHERFRLLRLLRAGEVVQAMPSKDTLYDQRDAVMTVGDTTQGRVLVLSPPPVLPGGAQGLLVGRNGDVVAWDLLPFAPVIGHTGAITAR
jgi:hypothetical protein